MKYLTLFLLYFSLNTFAQKSDVFHIDSLPTEGVLLNKNWKWHEGDNPEWAKADFDDSAWESIDPTKDIFDLPQISKNGQIGWFRLRLSMDESLLKKQISLVIQQTGASEIYLNGLKIITNGVINTQEIIAKDPLWKPFPINLHDEKQQVIAVKFALQPNILYTAIFENYNPAFWINVMDSEEAVAFHYSVTSKNLIFIFLIIGFSLMIFFIHSSFYLLYPNQKANLYFSLFALFLLLGSLSQYFYWLQPFQVSYKFYLGNLAFFFFIIGYFNLLKSAYLFLEIKKDFAYYLIAIFAIAAVILNAYPYNIGWKIGGPLLMLSIQINIARIAVKAVRKKLSGSWIITIGAFCTLIFFSIFMSQGTFTNTSFLLSLPLKRMINYVLYCLSLPISTSLFLAFQFANISKGLKRKILENEALSTEKQQILANQNETLEKQVTERTAELEHKNRDLEIEAALERIRSRAMAMQHSDELSEAANLLSKEVRRLGIPIWSCGYNIMEKDEQACLGWMSTEGSIQPSFRIPLKVSPTFIKFYESRQNGVELFEEKIDGADLETHYNYMLTLPDFAEIIKGFMNSGNQLPTFQVNTVVNFKQGNLIFISAQPVPEAHDIFKRFAYVFEQTFTRFLDLQKAEAQAREAQIELSLERVRARTMAMHHSIELGEAANLLFQQVQALGIPAWSCGYNIWEKGEKVCTGWMSSNGILQPPFKIPLTESPSFIRQYESKQKGEDFYTEEVSGEALAAHYQYMGSLPDFGEILKDFFKSGFTLPNFQINHIVNFKQGNMVFITGQPVPDAWDIFKRFAKVFEQTYTRFLDLQKAEAQAREAQIELALERVRARTMAMQHSEELRDTSLILFQQLKDLGEPAEQCTIGIIKESEGVVEISATLHGNKMQQTFRHRLDEPFIMAKMFKSWKDQKKTLVLEIKEEELQKYNQYRNELVGKEIFPVKLLPGDRWITHIAYFPKGILALSTNEPRPAESLQLLERFAIVFQQTYTRFLDLQKAEAQAREAQIEMALERVRSRTMSMQKSEHLVEVINVVAEQLLQLNFRLNTASFFLNDESEEFTFWLAAIGESNPDKIVIPKLSHPVLNNIKEAQKNGVDFWADNLSFEEKNTWFQHVFAHSSGRVPEDRQKYILNTEGYARSVVLMKQIGLFIVNYVPQPYTDAENAIFKRFAFAFEQAYIRFLDLQKAEAQAREAQIEAALERVRSASLAIHQSHELEKVVVVLFDKLKDLGVTFDAAFIYLFEKSTRNIEAWVATKLLPAPIKVKMPYDESVANNPIIVDLWYAIENGEHGLNKSYKEKDKDDYFRYEAKHNPSLIPESVTDLQLEAESWTTTFASEKNSIIGFDSWEGHLTTNEDFQILKRFARVFEQAYTRFLDLQKAEAQAREAQIQLSLERIRAKAMAMQRTDELSDFLTVLFEQFEVLNLNPVNSQLSLLDIENNRSTFRLTGKKGAALIATQEIDLDASPVWKQKVEELKAGHPNDVDVIHIPFESLPEIAEIFKEILEKLPADECPLPEDFPNGQYVIEGYCKYGYLGYSTSRPPSDEEKEITRRIATEFGNVYQRFLDLQKAEAQAKEAQIQLSLERIRAKAMSMQHSDELSDFLTVLFEQFDVLNLNPVYCHLTFFDIDNNRSTYRMTGKKGSTLIATQEIDLDASPVWKQQIEEWKAGHPNDVDVLYIPCESFPEITEIFKEILKKLPEDECPLPEDFPNGQYVVEGYCKYGYIGYSASQPPSDEEKEITRRIATEFGNVYQRFLDLQKAEAQAREAQIQLALERVRARTMAMQKSEELSEVSYLLNKQVVELGIPTRGCAFNIYNENDSTEWFSNLEGTMPAYHTPRENIFLKYYEAGQRGESLLIEEFGGERIKELYKYFATLNDCRDETINNHIANVPDYQINHMAYFKYGYLLFVTLVPSPDAHEIFVRFAREFEQTYTRFLDLQKAETQAREAQIEMALEKIRARALAMHASHELYEVAHTLRAQMGLLNQPELEASVIHLYDVENGVADSWHAYRPPSVESGEITSGKFQFRFDESALTQLFLKHYESNDNEYTIEAKGDILREWAKILFEKSPDIKKYASDKIPEIGFHHFSKFSGGALLMVTRDNPSDIVRYLQKRAASVFDFAYKRFLDLQKAEAQAREAQIEIALERVRSKTLAMQSSDELSTVIGLIYQEMGKLNVQLQRCFFMIFNPQTLGVTWWMASGESLDLGQGYFVPYSEHPPQLAYVKGWQERQETWRYLMQGEEKALWDAFLFHETELTSLPSFIIDNMKSFKSVHLDASFSSFGCLTTGNEQPLNQEAFDLLIRFSKVFDLTYTRFNDIKQAEAQAREAQIELALERVRSRAMSMQTSEEINAVIGKIFTECKSLEIQLDASVIIIYDKQTLDTAWYLTNHQDPNYPARFRVPHNEYPFNIAMLNAWHEKTIDWDYMLDVQEKKEWDKFVFSKTDFVLLPDNIKEVMAAVEKLYIKAAFNEFGCLMLTSLTPLNNEQMTILPRFSKVFELTYTRFNDLKLAEAQAKEGRIEIALERIRAKALAMESSTEINTVIATIYKECNTLFMDIIASLIIIYNEDTLDTDWYIAKQEDPDFPSGFRIPYNKHNFSLAMLEGWQQKNNDWAYTLKADEKAAWDDFIFSETDFSLLPDIVRNAMRSEPTLYTRAAFGDFGCVMLSTLHASSNDQKLILARITNVFDFAYTRFKDLQQKEKLAKQAEIDLINLKEEKRKTDQAITELKATQAQLIQKEKLASLGELTAGIAHEIQNPLNFVNNFSELSVDLVKDLKDEIEKPTQDKDYIGELFDDLSQNQEKINHHGKRASSIVKGMLEHSRASTGVKELTDINKLADEYLRLSYHGLRAKDKDFNADYELIIDENLPKIEVIPQDIGRVLLNLINNAFYAVNQRAQPSEGLKPSEGYTPSVIVSTKQLENFVEIRVKDNGIGMPESIRAKVFQPFFTTKPTGQGTGLGLSLAYDIVTKGHGGSLEVQSTEGVGSEFKIILPT